MKVLIADDSTDTAERVADLLREIEGVELVGPACDGDEAVRMFNEHGPEVAVLDLNMPRRSGIEVLRAIRQQPTPCTVLILTSHDEPSLRAACLDAGADAFLHKTTDFELIVEHVLRHASRHARQP